MILALPAVGVAVVPRDCRCRWWQRVYLIPYLREQRFDGKVHLFPI